MPYIQKLKLPSIFRLKYYCVFIYMTFMIFHFKKGLIDQKWLQIILYKEVSVLSETCRKLHVWLLYK